MAATTVAAPSGVVQFPRSENAVEIPARKPITQFELETVFLLRKALQQRQELLAWIEASLRVRLKAGAPVEPGIHTAGLLDIA